MISSINSNKIAELLEDAVWLEFYGTFHMPRTENPLDDNRLADDKLELTVNDTTGEINITVLDRQNFETIPDDNGEEIPNEKYDGRLLGGYAFVVPEHDGEYLTPATWAEENTYPPEYMEVYINICFTYQNQPYRFIAGLHED